MLLIPLTSSWNLKNSDFFSSLLFNIKLFKKFTTSRPSFLRRSWARCRVLADILEWDKARSTVIFQRVPSPSSQDPCSCRLTKANTSPYKPKQSPGWFFSIIDGGKLGAVRVNMIFGDRPMNIWFRAKCGDYFFICLHFINQPSMKVTERATPVE